MVTACQDHPWPDKVTKGWPCVAIARKKLLIVDKASEGRARQGEAHDRDKA